MGHYFQGQVKHYFQGQVKLVADPPGSSITQPKGSIVSVQLLLTVWSSIMYYMGASFPGTFGCGAGD